MSNLALIQTWKNKSR